MLSGHIQRFIEVNLPLFDHLVVYDDASTDGTCEFLEQYADVLVRGQFSMFRSELQNKQILLEASSHLVSDTDFYLWLDADEVVLASRTELKIICKDLLDNRFDSAVLPFINLWRSTSYFRTDNYFNDLEKVHLWQCKDGLSFETGEGLHKQLHPNGLVSTAKLKSPSVLHFGFADDLNLLRKYAMYKQLGQRGSNLYRLVSESGRSLVNLRELKGQIGSRFDEFGYLDGGYPERKENLTWYLESSNYFYNQKNSTTPLVTLVSLIYCSVEWLEFQYSELLKISRSFKEGEIEILFVANNATSDVLNFLEGNGIPYVEAETILDPDEWFINYVYRGYNIGVNAAKGKYVLLTNSDMAYGTGFLQNLLRVVSPKKFVTSRLIEMGRFQTGMHGIERNFGSTPHGFRRSDFGLYCQKISNNIEEPGGLYMPLLVERTSFLNLGGYPEGNLSEDSLSTYLIEGVVSKYAKKGEKCIPGDFAFFELAKRKGYEHSTNFASLSYHFQAGERTSEGQKVRKISSGIAIVNDRLIGVNGEKVLWGELVSRFRSKSMHVQTISNPSFRGRLRFWLIAIKSLHAGKNKPRVVFSNATFTYPMFGKWKKLVLRQDMPGGSRLMDRYLRFWQRVNLSVSDCVVANDADFVSEFRGNGIEWLAVPLASVWESEPEQRELNVEFPIGMFIGAFNETKGWNTLKDFIIGNAQIHWIIISKYADDNHGLSHEALARVDLRRNVDQSEIQKLMGRATFLVVNSPYETQCLVALEAASQNLPILTTPTGIVGNLNPDLANGFGIVDPQPILRINDLLDRIRDGDEFLAPRKSLEELGIFGEIAWKHWENILERTLEDSFADLGEPGTTRAFLARIQGGIVLRVKQLIREAIRPRIVKSARRLGVLKN
jgi:glycosyltransferase involved in cell wall biosynthesis